MTTQNFSKGAFILKKNTEAKQPYHFVLVGPSKKTLLLSENYVNSYGARNGIDSVRINGTEEQNYELKTATDGKFYFDLKAKNHEIIGRGMLHNAEAQRDKDIEDIMKYCENAPLTDETSGNKDGVTTSEPKRNGSNRYA